MLETLDRHEKQVIREVEAELCYQAERWGAEHDADHGFEEWIHILEKLMKLDRQPRHLFIKIAATAISAAVAFDVLHENCSP